MATASNTPAGDMRGRRIVLKEGQERPIDEGGLSYIWLCVLDDSDTREEVALKVLRSAKGTEGPVLDLLKKRLNREITVWKGLNHPHVTRLYGFCDPAQVSPRLAGPDGVPALVSPYYPNENVYRYLLKPENADVDRLKLVKQVASGLHYLHAHKPKVIVHGDVKGANVLVDNEGNARLTDFGLSRIVGETGFTTKNPGGSLRYTAAELVLDATGKMHKTTASDVWSFGITALEILETERPFPNHTTDMMVIAHILGGGRPVAADYPNTVAAGAWGILERCWADVAVRPNIDAIVTRLSQI